MKIFIVLLLSTLLIAAGVIVIQRKLVSIGISRPIPSFSLVITGAVAGYFGGFTSLIGTILFILSIARYLSLGIDLKDDFIKVAFIGGTGAIGLGFGLAWIIQQAIRLGESLSQNSEK
jgi:hypothetical protein